MSKFAEFTELPTPGYTVKEKGRTYLNEAAVKAAKKKTGAWIELADGHLMDKAYFGTLEGQAAKIDNRLEVAFVSEKRERNKNTPSGIPSYSYKGRVFLRYIDAVTEAQAAELARKKKAKEARRRAKREARELAGRTFDEQAVA